MDNQTRCVDYGRDIAELRKLVKELQQDIAGLKWSLDVQGKPYDCSRAYVDDSFPKSVDGFQTNYKLGGII